MAGDIEQGGNGGLSRRQMIKAAGVAGVAAWTAPMIIDSLTSPAAAVSCGPAANFPCSYATIVYQVGSSVFAIKVNTGTSTCQLTSATSGDATFSVLCPSGHTYSNTCSGNLVCDNGNPVNPGTDCQFAVSGSKICAGPGVTILFVAVHNGGSFVQTSCAPGANFTASC